MSSSILLSLLLVLISVLITAFLKYYIDFQRLLQRYKQIPGDFQLFHPLIVKILFPNFAKKLLHQKYHVLTQVFVSYADALFKKNKDAPFVKLILGNSFPLVFCKDAEFAKFFALKENKVSIKQLQFFKFLESQFGPSVLSLADESKWKRHRLISEPAFTQKALVLQCDVVVDTVREYIKIIENTSNSTRSILDDGCCLTLDVIGKVAFGFDFKAVEGAKAPNHNPSSIAARTNSMLQNFFLFQFSPEFVKKVPLGPIYEIHQAEAGLKQVVAEIISSREQERQQGIVRPKADILDLLMKGTELEADESDTESEQGERKKQAPLTKEELSANCISFLIAGHETTARALVFCSYLLSTHKDVQKKAQAQIDKVLQERDAPEHSDLDALDYIDAIIKETLRLYPVVRATGRRLTTDVEFKGTTIPAGTLAFMYFPAMLRDPAFWKDPEEFKPERWLEEETRNKLSHNPFQYLVFGFGKHVCIGKRLATMELIIVLSMLLKKFTLNLENEADYGEMLIDDMITSRPTKPVRIQFEKRQ